MFAPRYMTCLESCALLSDLAVLPRGDATEIGQHMDLPQSSCMLYHLLTLIYLVSLLSLLSLISLLFVLSLLSLLAFLFLLTMLSLYSMIFVLSLF